MHGVLTEQIKDLRADPDLDPVRKAQAIASLAAHVVALLEQFEKLPRPAEDAEAGEERVRLIEELYANVHRALAEQIETLRADPNIDREKRARSIARLERQELRLRHLHFRRIAEARQRQRPFDLVAVLNQALEENKPKIEAMKAAAERSANEANGRAEDPAS
jgi:hypothetical protein